MQRDIDVESSLVGSATQGIRQCSTCEIISELSDGFMAMTPQVEAIYIEHLNREHGLCP